MNKTAFVDALQAKLDEDFEGMSRKDVTLILEAVEETVAEALKGAADKEPIPILPGALKVYKRWAKAKKARMGVNPQTGEPMRLKAKKAHWVVKATPLKRLKEAAI